MFFSLSPFAPENMVSRCKRNRVYIFKTDFINKYIRTDEFIFFLRKQKQLITQLQ